jgi:hypothetical protein
MKGLSAKLEVQFETGEKLSKTIRENMKRLGFKQND